MYLHLSADDLAAGSGRGGPVGGRGTGDTRLRARAPASAARATTSSPSSTWPTRPPSTPTSCPTGSARRSACRTPADGFPYSPAPAGASTPTTPSPDRPDARPPAAHRGPWSTRLGNLAPAGPLPHRIKTHGSWVLRQPFDGIYLWRDPHGLVYLEDHTGTREVTEPGQPAGRHRVRPRGRGLPHRHRHPGRLRPHRLSSRLTGGGRGGGGELGERETARLPVGTAASCQSSPQQISPESTEPSGGGRGEGERRGARESHARPVSRDEVAQRREPVDQPVEECLSQITGGGLGRCAPNQSSVSRYVASSASERRAAHPGARRSVRTPVGRDRPDSVYAGPPPSSGAQGRLDPAGGEVGALLARPRRACRTAPTGSRAPGSTASSRTDGVVHAAVEDQAERVVPAAPGRQPVGEQQGDRPSTVQAELLLDLAGDRELRRLADLDDAAGQVPVVLVGQLAQQHPAVGVAHQHLRDRPLAGQEGVQQRPEARSGSVLGGSVASRASTTIGGGVGAVGHPGHDPLDALAAQPGAGGDAQRPLVARVDLGLDPLRARGRRPRSRRAAARPGWRSPGRARRRTASRTARRRRRRPGAPRRCRRPLRRARRRSSPASARRRTPPASPPRPAGAARVTASTGQPNQRAISSSWPATAAATSSSRQGRSTTTPSVSVGCGPWSLTWPAYGQDGRSQSVASGGRVSDRRRGLAVVLALVGRDHPEVADARPGVRVRVGVQQLRPGAAAGAARAGSRGGVRPRSSRRTPADRRPGPWASRMKLNTLLAGVVGVDPREPGALGVQRPQRGACPCRCWFMSRTSECTPRWSALSSSHQSSSRLSAHSDSWPNSEPMNSSCLPGCAHM